MARSQGIPGTMNLSGNAHVGWKAVGGALPPALAGIMALRGAAPFTAPRQAQAQAQRSQRVWLGVCCNPTRPA
eukprot:7254253-Alexandrium_andersonii.AAC.1